MSGRVVVEKSGAYWRAVTRVDGVRRRKNIGRIDDMGKRAAQAAAEEWAEAQHARRGKTTSLPTTVLAWYDRVAAKRGANNKSTATGYATARGYLDKWLGGRDRSMFDIEPEDAESFREFLINRGLAEQTIRGHCRRVKVAFTDAGKMGIIKGENPFDAVPTATAKSDVDWEYVSTETIQKLAQNLPERLGTALMIARFAALRLGEIKRLEWRDIQLSASVLMVRHSGQRTTKRRARTVPIAPELADYLGTLEQGDGAVCPGLLSSGASRGYESINVAAKILELGEMEAPFQNCRRSCITDWARLVPLVDVARIAGNSVSVIEQHYHQVLPDSLNVISGRTPPKGPHIGG